MLERIKAWVMHVEAAIDNDSPPEEIAKTLKDDLPEEAMEGIVNYPAKLVIGEIVKYAPARGPLTSEKGIEYMAKVQEFLKNPPKEEEKKD